ncbi:MAG: response regulator [Verrucomicrobiae bacterium]|nr:response regulator [Verrucomicrobiae bacterium]
MFTSVDSVPALKSVLLVDDNEMDNKFHSIIIRRTGLADCIQVALHGREAIELLRESAGTDRAPELILLDINMPVMNGFEFLAAFQELKEELGLQSVVIVMLTTSIFDDDREKADKFPHLKGYLTKPLTADSFKMIVNKHLRK